MATRRRPRHLEAQHQRTLIQWAKIARLPAADDIEPNATVADYLFAIPNGGKRNAIEAAMLKAEGVKAGVSDLMLPIARNGAHGLWVEMKAIDGKETDTQGQWRQRMFRAGYRAIVCHGWTEARLAIMEYAGIGKQRGDSNAESRP